MPTWDPAQYLQFGSERLRPAIDLLARIPLETPCSVYDLGCGPGTATALLAARWPKSRLTGVDSSPAMLERARALYPAIAWREADLEAWTPDQPADVIFSNAALHWIDRHEILFPRLASFLSPGGVLAVQMPFNFTAPIHTFVEETIRGGPWRERLDPCLRPWHSRGPEQRYFPLRRCFVAPLRSSPFSCGAATNVAGMQRSHGDERGNSAPDDALPLARLVR